MNELYAVSLARLSNGWVITFYRDKGLRVFHTDQRGALRLLSALDSLCWHAEFWHNPVPCVWLMFFPPAYTYSTCAAFLLDTKPSLWEWIEGRLLPGTPAQFLRRPKGKKIDAKLVPEELKCFPR